MHAKEKPNHANYVTNVFTDEVNRLTSQMGFNSEFIPFQNLFSKAKI